MRQFADQQSRYQAIDRHLRAVSFPHKVGFEYQPKGIRIHGEWYPILKMEWVPGVLLNEYVESLVGREAALQKLADDWLALLRAMKAARIAHGDLQHGNVLIADGKLRLIDYDGMYVPALAGMGSHELGHPSYQHPRRGPDDYGPEMDRFAALVIHVAILAVACEPSLWRRFNNGDNLLFRRNDFLQPADSPVFDALLQLNDREVVRRAILLQVAGVGPIAQVPEVESLVLAAAAPARQRVLVGAAAPRPDGAGRPASRLPEWVAEQLLAQPIRVPAPPVKGIAFTYRLAWKRPGAKASAASRPAWLEWLPVPSVSEQGHARAVNAVAFVLQGGGWLRGATTVTPSSGRWRRAGGWRSSGGHDERVAAVAAVGPSLVATASWDQQVRLWNRWGILKKKLKVEGSSRVYGLAGSADGRRIASCGADGRVIVWAR